MVFKDDGTAALSYCSLYEGTYMQCSIIQASMTFSTCESWMCKRGLGCKSTISNTFTCNIYLASARVGLHIKEIIDYN